jgi:hypothetical protein
VPDAQQYSSFCSSKSLYYVTTFIIKKQILYIYKENNNNCSVSDMLSSQGERRCRPWRTGQKEGCSRELQDDCKPGQRGLEAASDPTLVPPPPAALMCKPGVKNKLMTPHTLPTEEAERAP